MRPMTLRSTVLVAVSLALIAAQQCLHPPPAPNFSLESYTGVWYEIAKVQTFGGAIFEHNCVCTQLIITPEGTANGDATALNSCRNLTPEGAYINATGYLTNQNPPGRWTESFFPGVPGVNYTVILLGDDYSVEYDCGESLFGVNYCIHILSRTPTMESTLFNKLLNTSLSMGLNTQHLGVNMTLQAGCW